jgi:hypothetical protein
MPQSGDGVNWPENASGHEGLLRGYLGPGGVFLRPLHGVLGCRTRRPRFRYGNPGTGGRGP